MLGKFATYVKDRIQGKVASGEKRSSKWSGVRAAHLKENPKCAVCGGTDKVEVHHVIPFHIAPQLELNPLNLISLCESKKGGLTCHLAIGHLGNYRRANPHVREHADMWNRMLNRPAIDEVADAIAGMAVKIDPTLPEGVAELRTPMETVRIENIADPKEADDEPESK